MYTVKFRRQTEFVVTFQVEHVIQAMGSIFSMGLPMNIFSDDWTAPDSLCQVSHRRISKLERSSPSRSDFLPERLRRLQMFSMGLRLREQAGTIWVWGGGATVNHLIECMSSRVCQVITFSGKSLSIDLRTTYWFFLEPTAWKGWNQRKGKD